MMRLEDISVTVRPRNAWESMDLGLQLLRREWRAVFIPWLLLSASIFVVLNLIFREKIWLASVLFWWLKPLYDRLLLSVFSQSLFGSPPTTGETLRALPALLTKTGLLTNLTLLRINVSRSFHLPVWQLEGLRGAARRNRIETIGANSRSYPFLLTLACLLLELSLHAGLLLLLYLMLPEQIDVDWEMMLFGEQQTRWLDALSNFLYFLAVLVIEPFYVAAGFMLYINRRTHLEAWDLELAFRRMARRLGSAVKSFVPVLLLVLAVGINPIGSADAQDQHSHTESASHSKQVITEVLATEEFNQYTTETFWLPRLKKSENRQEDTGGLEQFQLIAELIAESMRIIVWIAVAALVVILFIYRDRWLPLFRVKGDQKPAYHPPDALFGLELTPESLPADIPAAALQALNAGKSRAALALLYRGALSVLLNRDGMELRGSHTEGDILRLADPILEKHRSRYLHQLTRQWQLTAYAHQEPSTGDVSALCEHWGDSFGKTP